MSSPPTTTGKRKRSGDQEEEVQNVVKKAKKTPNLLGPQTIVTVNVRKHAGAKTHPFRIHKNYICHYSPYFEAAFNVSFIEGETQVLELEDTEPKIFGIFINWLYVQKITDEEGQLASCSDCINLWILADKILVPSLQNQALMFLEFDRSSGSKKGFASPLFHRVWDNTTEESPLRAYLVEVMVRKPKRSNITTPEHYPHGMLVAIINGLRKRERNHKVHDGGSQGSEVPFSELKRFFVLEGANSRKVVSVQPGSSHE